MSEKKIFDPDVIAIHGVGLLGGSLGLAFKESGFSGKIIGFSSPRSLETALSLRCIDEGRPYDALAECIGDVDVVFLCSPISVIMETLRALGTMELPESLVVTDVGSTKKQISALAGRVLPSHVHFIGGHPMAGSEKSGPSAADPFLFQNAVYVMAPISEKPEERDRRFADFLERRLGCRCIFLDPAAHDEIAAAVSHAPHILAVAMVNLAESVEQRIPGTLQLAAGGFRDLTRIASSPYAMWRDIFATNKEAVAPLLDQCIDILSDMKKELTEGSLESCFNDAHETRCKIPIDTKGFISQLHEIMVIVKDQPGVIAHVSTAIANEGVNILDIELLKVREGEAGTIRLAFDSEENARRALDILEKEGVNARKR